MNACNHDMRLVILQLLVNKTAFIIISIVMNVQMGFYDVEVSLLIYTDT